MVNSVINNAGRQWTLLCTLADCEYPFTVLGYVSFAVSPKAYIRQIKE
jgi:hypothetical protein